MFLELCKELTVKIGVNGLSFFIKVILNVEVFATFQQKLLNSEKAFGQHCNFSLPVG
jgi:hypothetical protein